MKSKMPKFVFVCFIYIMIFIYFHLFSEKFHKMENYNNILLQ